DSKHSRESARLDKGSPGDQAGKPDAEPATELPGAGRGHEIPLIPEVRMATTTYFPQEAGNPEALPVPSRLHEWIVTVDHKRLGILYIATALFFFTVAGVLAALMRLQLAYPNATFLPPDAFNRLFTMHGTSMVFLVGMPFLAGLANYLVPLMIGARDMAFPRLNAFGFWFFLFGGFLLYFSYIAGEGLAGHGSAPDVGWFAYAPLPGRAFLRYASRRVSSAVATLLLAVRASRGVHPDSARVRVRFRNHPGVFAQGDVRARGDDRRNGLHRLHQLRCVGAPYVRGG